MGRSRKERNGRRHTNAKKVKRVLDIDTPSISQGSPGLVKAEATVMDVTLEESPNYCSNCGINVDHVHDAFPLCLSEALYATDAVSVSDALEQVFKVKFPRCVVSDSSLCGHCAGILQDLFVLWKTFLAKSIQDGTLYSFFAAGENGAESLDGDPDTVAPLVLAKPKRLVKLRLEKKISRREKEYQAETNALRRSSRRTTKTEPEAENDLCEESSPQYPSDTEMDNDLDLSRDFAEYLDTTIKEDVMDPLSATQTPRHKAQSSRLSPSQTDFPAAPRRNERLGSSRKKVEAELSTALSDLEVNDSKERAADVGDDIPEVQITAKSLRQSRIRTFKTPASQDLLTIVIGDTVSESESGDEGSEFEPEGEESREAALEKRLSYQAKRLRKDRVESWKERARTGTVTKKFRCEECGRRFKGQMGLTKHVNYVHSPSSGPLICNMDTCGKKFSSRKALEEHINSHVGYKPYMCDQCGWSTNVESGLRSHLLVHLKPEEKEELKSKVCEECGAKFMKAHGLRNHMQVHTQDKPFKCPYQGCSATFKSQQRLRRHERDAHLVEVRTFPCPRCGRAFTRKENLTAHLQVHDKYEQSGGKMRKSRDPPPRKPTKRLDGAEPPTRLKGRPPRAAEPTNTTPNLPQ